MSNIFSGSDRRGALKIAIVINSIIWFYLVAKTLILIQGKTITNLEKTQKKVLVGHFSTVKTL